jgi:hypothetical protein
MFLLGALWLGCAPGPGVETSDPGEMTDLTDVSLVTDEVESDEPPWTVVVDEQGWIEVCAAWSGQDPPLRVRLDAVVHSACAVSGLDGLELSGTGGFASPSQDPAAAWLSFEDASHLVVRGLSFEGAATDNGVVSAVEIRAASADVSDVRLSDLTILDLGGGRANAVALSVWAEPGRRLSELALVGNRVERLGVHAGDPNSHAILVSTSTQACLGDDWTACVVDGGVERVGDDSVIERVLVRDNVIRDVSLGSSEALVIRGNVHDVAVVSNVVDGHDNIAIDLIGWEGDTIQARPDGSPGRRRYFGGISRAGVVGNAVSGQSKPERWGADFYADGASEVAFVGNASTGGGIGVSLSAETELALTLDRVSAVGNWIDGAIQKALVLGAEACSDDGAPIPAGLGAVVITDNLLGVARGAELEAKGLIGAVRWGRNISADAGIGAWDDCAGVAAPPSPEVCEALDVDRWCAEHQPSDVARPWAAPPAEPRWRAFGDDAAAVTAWASAEGLLPGPGAPEEVPAWVDRVLAFAEE